MVFIVVKVIIMIHEDNYIGLDDDYFLWKGGHKGALLPLPGQIVMIIVMVMKTFCGKEDLEEGCPDSNNTITITWSYHYLDP